MPLTPPGVPVLAAALGALVPMARRRWAGSAIVALAAGTDACKAAGPLLLGERPLPPGTARLVTLLPAALLAALVAVQTVVDDRALVLDARLAGVAVGAIAVWRKAPFLVTVVVACVATAVVRAVS